MMNFSSSPEEKLIEYLEVVPVFLTNTYISFSTNSVDNPSLVGILDLSSSIKVSLAGILNWKNLLRLYKFEKNGPSRNFL